MQLTADRRAQVEAAPRSGHHPAERKWVTRWRAGESTAALAGSWRPDEWLRLELRWDGSSFDAWVGDDGPVSASGLRPAQSIAAGLDEVRVSIPPTGALWVDEVRVEAAR